MVSEALAHGGAASAPRDNATRLACANSATPDNPSI